MISKERRERFDTKIVMRITLLFSVIFILAAFLLSEEYRDARNILISVSCSILASNLIMYFTSEYMMRSKRRMEVIDRWGVESIYETRSKMNDSANVALENCRRNMELIAFGIQNFREAKEKEILKVLHRGVSIKILTLNPNSALLSLVDKRENKVVGATKKSIEDLMLWSEKCNKNKSRGKIEVKLYDSLPLDFYFRLDDRIYIGPYIKGKSSQQTISYEFSSGEGYRYWLDYFNDQWDSAE